MESPTFLSPVSAKDPLVPCYTGASLAIIFDIVEAYPVETKSSKNTSLDGFTGFVQTYLRLGFRESIRRSEKRPLLRYYIPS